MLHNFIKWVFGRRVVSPNPREVTLGFMVFASDNAAEVANRLAATGELSPAESYENLLLRYIRTERKSPFLGDESFEEANRFLSENGVF